MTSWSKRSRPADRERHRACPLHVIVPSTRRTDHSLPRSKPKEKMREPRKKTCLNIGRIRSSRPSDVLAGQLRDAILRGEIPDGEVLPSETELMLQSGITRGSVRVALRLLGAEGLLQTRLGRFGGKIVTLPRNEFLASVFNQFIRGHKIAPDTAQQTCEILMPALARLAAIHRTAGDLAGLQVLRDDLEKLVENSQLFAIFDAKWHFAVATASGNELLSAILHSVFNYGNWAIRSRAEYGSASTRRKLTEIRGLVNASIEARNGVEAERLMTCHMIAARSDETPLGAREV